LNISLYEQVMDLIKKNTNNDDCLRIDPYIKNVFPKPPMTAFKRQKNVRDFLIQAKIYPPRRQHEK